MTLPEVPANERDRLRELHAYDVLDTLPEQAYDDITYLASLICETPISLVSLVDESRQWFKSRHGLDATETPRDLAFCAHALHEPQRLTVVPDATADPRFVENPLVTDDPAIRFYAGAPLTTDGGCVLGTLCVIDREPRQITDEQARALSALSRQVVAQLELRKKVAEIAERTAKLERYKSRLERYHDELEEANERLEERTRTDALTGLANRAAFDERLEEEFERAGRAGGSLSLLVIDIDHFKALNDRHGHAQGDTALREVAGIMAARARRSDLYARIGGEEFAAILPGTGPEGAAILAERLRRKVENGSDVTVSIGVAKRGDEADSPTALLEAADAALYRAKRAGRNRVAETEESRVPSGAIEDSR